jgi:hypothetical protein
MGINSDVITHALAKQYKTESDDGGSVNEYTLRWHNGASCGDC